MRRKRFRSVLAFVLALSMIFGSNASILADEVSDNTAPVEESVTQPPAAEDIQEPGGEIPADTDEEEPAVSEEPVQESDPADEKQDASVSDDKTDTVSENAEPAEEAALEETSEEAAGAGGDVKLFVSGDTVSYNGGYHEITVSSNVTAADGYRFIAWLVPISADNIKNPKDYSEDYYKNNGVSADFTDGMTTAAKVFTVSAANAGKYGVRVFAEKNGNVSANEAVFLSINKAAPISISVDSCSKYYDGTALLPGKAYEANGKELYTNAVKNKNDIDLVKVSGSQNDAGESAISVDVSELEKNYDKVKVSAGKLTVLSINLIIRSKNFTKNYDKKAVTDAERKGFTLEAQGADVAALTKSLSLSVDDFDWDPASLITGETITYISNNFTLNSSGEKKLYGAAGEKKKNFALVKPEPGLIRIRKKEHEWTSNGLKAPKILSADQDSKGFITITWKAAKTYKDTSKKDRNKSADEKKMDQARYMIYRYDDVNEDWILLNGANRAKKKDRESDKDFGQTGTKFVDKQAGREDHSTYIYKVNVIGYDEDGNYGMAKEASYLACRPMALSLATMQHDSKSLDFRFSKIRGSKTYVVEKSYTGKKDEFDESISISADRISEMEYNGSKLISPLSYKDDGKLVKSGVYYPAEAVYYTDKSLKKNTVYYYRTFVRTDVVDFGEDGAVLPQRKTVESKVSDVLKSKCKPYAPYVISSGTARYNQAAIAFEKLSEDIIPLGRTSKYDKNKYEILRATKPNGKYKVIASFSGKKLYAGGVKNLKVVAPNMRVSFNGVDYKVDYPSYVYLDKDIAPEITYYYKIRVVLDKVTGSACNPVKIRPVLTDVSSISANVNNYNKITVVTDHVTGSKQMVVTYRAVKTNTGKILSENTTKESTWKSKTFTVSKNSNNEPIDKYPITGLKHGYTYVFYAEPKNGKKHVTQNPKTVEATTRVGAPKVTTSPRDLDEVTVKWEKVKGATKYRLRIYDVENGNKLEFEKVFKKPGKHVWRGGSGGSLDPKRGLNDDLVGKPYRFEVTAYRKDSYTTSDGEWGIPAEKTDSGRPTGVKNLKVQVNKVEENKGYTFYPDGYLTWDHSADYSQKTPLAYMIERRVYKYKTNTDDSFRKDYTSSVILSKTDAYNNKLKYDEKTKKYTSYKSYRSKTTKVPFYHGDKVVYVVTPVYYSETAKKKGRGPDKDGYILGVPKKVTYITPAKIEVKNIELTVGESKKLSVSFKPKSTTVTDIVWSAPSQKYFTLEGAKVVGKAAMTKWNNDVYVQATGRISISGSRITSKQALVKVNPKGVDGKLKVCIDPGHGGKDSGATYNGLTEKSCNLDMAYAMKEELEKYKVPVVMTRYDDTFLEVGDRPNVAYSNGCNLFISIHCNSGGGSGTEVWKSITEYHDDALANKILANVTTAIGTGNRGVKTRNGNNGDYYGVIRGSASRKITGMIVEVAFMDGDYSKLNSYETRKAAGKAIADAVLESRGYK